MTSTFAARGVAWKPQVRRTGVLAVLTALTIAAMSTGKAQESPRRVALYAGLGDELTQYDLDVERALLLKRGSVTLPGKVGVSVYGIGSDGTIGSAVEQPGSFDVGIVQHQVRVNPSNKLAILVTRGNYT